MEILTTEKKSVVKIEAWTLENGVPAVMVRAFVQNKNNVDLNEDGSKNCILSCRRWKDDKVGHIFFVVPENSACSLSHDEVMALLQTENGASYSDICVSFD